MYNNFSVKLSNAYKDDYPCIEFRRRKNYLLKPYINADLRSLVKEEHRIQRLYCRFRTPTALSSNDWKIKWTKSFPKLKKFIILQNLVVGLEIPKITGQFSLKLWVGTKILAFQSLKVMVKELLEISV